ncbi:hypothetical protein VIGAN_06112500, partial [Vigna angularis var. angularis]
QPEPQPLLLPLSPTSKCLRSWKTCPRGKYSFMTITLRSFCAHGHANKVPSSIRKTLFHCYQISIEARVLLFENIRSGSKVLMD